jgi:hypothetical protein
MKIPDWEFSMALIKSLDFVHYSMADVKVVAQEFARPPPWKCEWKWV